MSNLSELLPAGAGAKSAQFVASGTLSSGQTVALNSDGTVSAVAESTVSENVGAASQIASSSSTWSGGISAAFDAASGTHVIFYRDNGDSSKGKAVVATPSGSSLSFGTPVVVDSSGITWPDIVYANSVEKVLVSHGAGTNTRGEVYVGTVSGTSISFGSAYAYADYLENEGSLAWSTDDNVFVVVWDDDNNYGESRVGSVSGTSISYGTEVAFETSGGNGSGISEIGIGYTTGSKVVVAYRDPASGTGQKDSYARVGTISGTSISWGARTLIKAGTNGGIWGTLDHKVCYDPISGKVLISYWNESNSDYPEVIVGTISGTSISFGTSVVVSSTGTSKPVEMVYNAAAEKIVLSYTKNSSTPLFSKLVTISGTTPSLSSELSMGTGDDPRGGENALSYDSTNKNVLVAYPNSNSPYGGKALIYTAEYVGTNSADFIGITDQAIANTATGAVIVQGGVSDKLSGLTVGADYYVQSDGSLASGSVPFSISGATFTQNFSVSAQDSSPRGIAFNTDGTKMFITGSAGVDINEYALTTGFDISTASYSQNFSVISETTSPRGVAFNTDGTKMFVVGQVGSTIYEYNLATGFNISTASYSQNFSLSSQETGAQDVAFNTDGTKMFIVGTSGQDVNEYTLSTGFDVSSASYSQNFSVSSQDTIPTGITFNTDGTSMFITGQTNDKVFEYTLTSGFDVSTASYSSTSFSVLSEESNPLGLVFNSNGTKMFITGTTGDDVNEYSTTPASTTVPAGRALSSTSILLEG